VEDILAFIKTKYQQNTTIKRSFVVEINGIDYSGKTTFAKAMSK